MKILVLGGELYTSYFRDNFPKYEVVGVHTHSGLWKQVGYYTNPKSYDIKLVVFTGGEDIHPSYYDNDVHPSMGFLNLKRDHFESDVFNFCETNNIPMVGICRGAQLGCVLSGGSLIQHVENHQTYHEITVPSLRRAIMVSSSHHQLMHPINRLYIDNFHMQVLGYTNNRSSFYEHKKDGKIIYDKPAYDVEIALFTHTRFLAHQPHPEWMDYKSDYSMYFIKTVNDLLRDVEEQ